MRRIISTGLIVGSSLVGQAQASVIGVVDSGVDLKHEKLVNQVWVNPSDSSFDRIDNDKNGFVDDVNGWNFIENSPKVIDYKYGKFYNSTVQRFFTVQDAALEGKASPADLAWLKEAAQDPAVLKQIVTYGNYAHGTHIAGLSLTENPEARILTIKLVPTENPLAGLKQKVATAVEDGKSPNWIVRELIKGGLTLLAKAQGIVFAEVAAYLDEQHVDVSNLSLGVGASQARAIVTPLLQLANQGSQPKLSDVDALASFFLERVNIEQAILLKKAPDTLFIFAAGNDGLSNDTFPAAPASIRHPHALSVAAVDSSGQLTAFSNFGKVVDLAAPGVSILSSVPDNRYLKLSGTSQAAPQVTAVAAQIKDINPKLDADAIREILLKTVDIKPELKAKVNSSGILNSARALAAAEGSKTQSLNAAIQSARVSIVDVNYDLDLQSDRTAPLVQWQQPFLF